MPRWMGDAESESGVTNQSSDGSSVNIFDGYSSDSSGSEVVMNYPSESEEMDFVGIPVHRQYAVGHQHYGLGPEPCCQQEEVELEEDSERDSEEV
ncbi:unnamed protein product [Arabis nemorensis]|uniref:Uncharacterized protein n=1 Tax=Arabis nemorensis TaxID=586526 RepID=A0A565BJM0_9BRAS|nr:unnamed protein product [Arabis nemorensis]